MLYLKQHAHWQKKQKENCNMSDLYFRAACKKRGPQKDRLVKGGDHCTDRASGTRRDCYYARYWIAAIVLGVCAYLFIFPGTDLEFEYLFVNGELDIDKIMAKSKRKRVKSLNITECDIMAPLNSHRMDYYNSNQKLKVQDFSSGNPEHKRFTIVCRDGADTCKAIIEPDEILAKPCEKYSFGSKVFLRLIY